VKRRWVQLAVAVAICLGALLTRVFWDGRAALAEGDAAHRRAAGLSGDAARQEEEEAIRRWRRAARWYAPGAPHVAAAYDRLRALASSSEDPELALVAWRAIRSSSLATRSFYTPFEDRLGEANRHIATLMAASDTATGSREEKRAFHLALLERDEAPSVFWSIFAVLGFFTWVGGGFWFAFRGVTAEDRLDRRQAATAGVLVVLGMAVWMVSLYQA
jgi:hypothetical protein